MTGLVLIIIGIAFLLKNLGIISSSVWGFIWPALLVALGIWFLLRGRGRGFFIEERIGWRAKNNPDEEEAARKLF
jgi:uncharacterized membrane protein